MKGLVGAESVVPAGGRGSDAAACVEVVRRVRYLRERVATRADARAAVTAADMGGARKGRKRPDVREKTLSSSFQIRRAFFLFHSFRASLPRLPDATLAAGSVC